MAGYSSFSLKSVKKTFNLIERNEALFHKNTLKGIPPTQLLTSILERAKQIPLNNEKSRSEYIVAQVMLEVKAMNMDKIGLYSGENLEADKEKGLNGECDFIFSKSPHSSTIETPIFCLVEAENENLMSGLGQCVAQMLGAKIVNERENTPISEVYGCVTTGDDWMFLKLKENVIHTDTEKYYLDNLPQILAIFQEIVNRFC
jgi:co-chaperonin GroES (HSP10)